MKQVIYSRYEFVISEEEYETIFDVYMEMFKPDYDENGVQIGGVGVAVALEDPKRAILMTFTKEAEVFLRLKFAGRSDVKVNRYYNLEEKYG